jgi:hypothetical protein
MRSLGALALAAALLLSTAATASAQKFRGDDPLAVDHDDLEIAKPARIELSTTYDVLEHTFGHRPHGSIAPAVNVNTFGEVPDSSWFQNRIGSREMSLEELVRGPDQGGGPDVSGPWTVIAAKSGGITPGFRIRDSRGEIHFVKFDPVEHPSLATAAEVIGTKLFHAMGYHVPENHIAYFRRSQLAIAPEAQVTRRGGKRASMTAADLDLILSRVPVRPDGTIRCVAGRQLPGEDVGPHKYHGTRGDDPNDVFPHEDRRELRGLRVFAAWLNHDDSRSINSADRFLAEGERGYVKHYLLDFSSTLGSGSDALRRIAPQNPRAGNEYVLDWGPAAKAAVTLGLWERPWRKVRYVVFPEVGRIEADFFRPERWKPEYPNPAFERMLPADAFWAARIVSRFTDEMVRAAVHAGEFSDPAAERHLADTLIKRRDKVVAHYFRAVNPLAEFQVTTGGAAPALEFANLWEKAGLGAADAYEYQWFAFENQTGALRPLHEVRSTAARRVPVPSSREEFLMVRLRTRGQEPAWMKSVDVYLRGRTDPPALVGIEREG